MKHKKLLGSISCLLTLLLLFYVTLPGFSAEGLEQDAQVIPTEYEDYTVPGSSDGIEIQMDTGERPPVYEDGAILIYHYQQLLLIGSGAALTDTDYLSDGVGGGEAILCDDGDVLTYGMDSRYRIVNDIALPRHTMWQLPEGFCGVIAGETAEDQPLYDEDDDMVYLYHPYQLAVTAAEDAAIQPVMSGDADASTFGTGQVIPAGDGYLTYSDTHRYVIRSGFTTEIKEIPVSIRRKADIASVGAAAQYDGRDFAGQVIKEINGETYILIGNADQLRAIGTDAKVCGPVYKMKAANITLTRYEVDTDSNGNPILLYGGDADLLQSQNGYADFSFQSITNEYPRAGADPATGAVYTGSTGVDSTSIGTAHSWETDAEYSAKANYIIFRDIDLGGSANPWTPLMFTGNMYGIKSTNSEKLWDGSSVGDATALNARTTANRPVISNLYINNSSPIEVDKFIGIGFFATITNEINTADIGVSGGTVHVENIELNQV